MQKRNMEENCPMHVKNLTLNKLIHSLISRIQNYISNVKVKNEFIFQVHQMSLHQGS